jgi:hypothetical protein
MSEYLAAPDAHVAAHHAGISLRRCDDFAHSSSRFLAVDRRGV